MTTLMICRIMSYFGKFSNTSSYLYLQIRINTFMYVIVVYIQKYAHICCGSYWEGVSAPAGERGSKKGGNFQAVAKVGREGQPPRTLLGRCTKTGNQEKLILLSLRFN